MPPTRIEVHLPGHGYDALIGRDLLRRLDAHVRWPNGARQAALVTSPAVGGKWADPVVSALSRAGLGVTLVHVPDGEAAKTPDVLAGVWERLAAVPLERSDLVVALGGGAVTDLAGFAAATWHRGVAVMHVSTTLLGQVDAAVGGKTAVNLAAGKNLVGAFHQPAAVICDIDTLATLPARELRSGLGEVAKYGFIADPEVLRVLERDPARAIAGDPALLSDLVVRGVRVKARVVASDEREAGERALLNYGHTLAHAIESCVGYGHVTHGEAVAIGMVFAARLGERLGVSERGLADRTAALLTPLGLPTGELEIAPARLWEAMTRDKKAAGGVRFVLCRTPGAAVLVDPPDPDVVLATLREFCRSAS